jgi:3-oxoacyl-(acyl-carrier-protein) synthase
MQALANAKYDPKNGASPDDVGALPRATTFCKTHVCWHCQRLHAASGFSPTWCRCACRLGRERPLRAGVCIGAGMAGVAQVVDGGRHVLNGNPRRVSPYFVPSILNNMAAGAPCSHCRRAKGWSDWRAQTAQRAHLRRWRGRARLLHGGLHSRRAKQSVRRGSGAVSIDHGFRGPTAAPSTACATGLHAVGEAFHALQRRDAPMMLAGSADACIDAVSLTGFARMRALATTLNGDTGAASRPFDRSRNGFVMGEGAGVV